MALPKQVTLKCQHHHRTRDTSIVGFFSSSEPSCSLNEFKSSPPGTRLGGYEIRSQLGVGGMGEVYLAHDLKLDRKVALKTLPGEVAGNRQRMQRFVQEAKAASALNHPNIFPIYEIAQAGRTNFIATEFIDGETLRECLRREPMRIALVLDLTIQIATALSAAHHAVIVHRDIKPENIMLRRDSIVKVLDFGLAKLIAFRIATKTITRLIPQGLPKLNPGLKLANTFGVTLRKSEFSHNLFQPY